MNFMKEHTISLMLSILSLLLCIVLGSAIFFTWRLQDTIDAQRTTISEQNNQITSLTATNTVLEQELKDEATKYASLEKTVIELEATQKEVIEELKKLAPSL